MGSRVEARNQFKEYVNTLATIRNDEGEKNLVLKKKYRQLDMPMAMPTPPTSPGPSLDTVSLSSVASSESLNVISPSRQPPPYRAPPPPSPGASSSPVSSPLDTSDPPSHDPEDYSSTQGTPPVPPRRKSSDKLRLDNKENVDISKRPKTAGAEAGAPLEGELELEEQISVKERTQKFNLLATEGELQRVQGLTKRNADKDGADERGDGDGDTSSVTSLDVRAREWLVRAAQGDHLALTKLAAENPKLARLKDPTSGYTALHWGAKHGNEHVVKLIAGAYNADVNARTHGGYTAAHIAMQAGHEMIFNLLVQVYYADPNLRDWSGRKPRQYQTSLDTAVSADTFRKIKARKKHSEKDLGFLRIGSLNVRVKRTTEAFSNFLGVGNNSDKLHKSWGSADNIQQVDRRNMPPPKMAPIKKRRSRRAQDFAGSHSTPSTPPSHIRTGLIPGQAQDSDSDTACGFGSNWQGTA